MKIYANLEFDKVQKVLMTEIAGSDEIYFGDSENPTEQDKQEFFSSSVAFGSCPPIWLEQALCLKWMQLESVGFGEYTNLDWDKLGQRIVCTNLKGFFSIPVSETVLAGILSLCRCMEDILKSKETRQWIKLRIRSQAVSLYKKNVLIAGYGAIGRRIEKLLQAFDCSVITYDKCSAGAALQSIDELDITLPQMDIVIAAMPDTMETRGLFDGIRLDMMKDKAIFVNVGRGSLIDEKALIQRLKSGKLGGAVLDVTEVEPLPVNHPIWNCPNTILTQHTAGGTHDELDRKIEFFRYNLSLFRQGKPLENIIDWKIGY